MPGPKAPEETRRDQILESAYRVAIRNGIPGITLRAVAGEAGLSHGLVLFHFKKKEQLVASLLARVLSRNVLLLIPDHPQSSGTVDRVSGMLGRQLEAIVARPDDVRLFFGYLALGATVPSVRAAMSAAVAAHEAAYRDAATEESAAAGRSSTRVAADMASMAVSLVHGCAIRAIGAADSFDARAYAAMATAAVRRAGQVGG